MNQHCKEAITTLTVWQTNGLVDIFDRLCTRMNEYVVHTIAQNPDQLNALTFPIIATSWQMIESTNGVLTNRQIIECEDGILDIILAKAIEQVKLRTTPHGKVEVVK